jgi:hypothetical protein
MTLKLGLFPLDRVQEALLERNKVIVPGDRLWIMDGYGVEAQFRGAVATIRVHPFPKGTKLCLCDETGETQFTKDDSFGDPISFAYAYDLSKLEVPPGIVYHNAAAVLAYINNVRAETRFVTWWEA